MPLMKERVKSVGRLSKEARYFRMYIIGNEATFPMRFIPLRIMGARENPKAKATMAINRVNRAISKDKEFI